MFEYNYNILTFDGHYSIDVGYFFSFTEYRHNFVHSLNNLLFSTSVTREIDYPAQPVCSCNVFHYTANFVVLCRSALFYMWWGRLGLTDRGAWWTHWRQ